MQSLLARRQSGSLASCLSATRAFAANPGKGGAVASDKVDDSQLNKLYKLLEPVEVEPLNLSPEDKQEWARRSKEYSRLRMAEHRAWQRDLSIRLALKKTAIAALPHHLQAAALKEDLTPFPADRNIFTDTPPVADYGKKSTSKASGAKRLGTK